MKMVKIRKNKYSKIVEYKIIESKYKRKNNVEIVFTRKEVSIILYNIIESDIINQIINFREFSKKD